MLNLNDEQLKEFYSKIKTYQDFENFLKENNLNSPNEIVHNRLTLFSLISNSENLKNYNANKTFTDEKLNTDQSYVVHLLRFIIRHPKFDIDYRMNEYFNNTALMIKISNSEKNKSIVLINDFNASPFIPDNHGKNTLHLLIAKARKSNIVIDRMHHERYDNMLPVFEKILQHKDIAKHINDKDENGNTALHIAMARRDLDYTIPLINADANLNIKNNNELSPIDILKSDNDIRMEILRTILSPWNDDKLYIKNDNKNIAHPISPEDKEARNYLFQERIKTKKEIDSLLKEALEQTQNIASFDYSTFNQDPDLILSEITKHLPKKNLDSFESKGKSNTL